MHPFAGAFSALLPHLGDLPGRLLRSQQRLLASGALDSRVLVGVNQQLATAMAALWRDVQGESAQTAFFTYLRKAHALQTLWCQQLLERLQLPGEEGLRFRFLLTQWTAACHPDNFIGSNPDALEKMWRSHGESLRRGQDMLRGDLARGRISMCDETDFEVGRNLACTPGAVVFENDIMQIIQYTPSTALVDRRPLLVVPPFINKYYVLDLSPENSFVRFARDSGLQVFMISWRNPVEANCALTWDDYASRGVGAATQVATDVTREARLDVCGFCVGGTLLSSALAAGTGQGRVASLTLLAALLDFSDVGDVRAYLDEDFVSRNEEQYGREGLVPGVQLAAAFASLRPESLIWRYVVQNYLMGETPAAFDLLYWNSDSTNVPGPLYTWYVRELYLCNKLRIPGAVRINGAPANLDQLSMPAYVVGAEKDHIVPWRSAYASAKLLSGDRQFVLASSGHIAGIVCPPGTVGRTYREVHLGDESPDAMRGSNPVRMGSWWPHWRAWLGGQKGRSTIRARAGLGAEGYPVIEPAPGRYVGVRT